MKKPFTLVLIFFISYSYSIAQSTFELSPNQSMSITGKGPGQDAAINPYLDKTSIAVIQNLGKNAFDVRVQNKEQFIEITEIKPGEMREIKLLQGFELYLDSEEEGKADIKFKEFKEGKDYISTN